MTTKEYKVVIPFPSGEYRKAKYGEYYSPPGDVGAHILGYYPVAIYKRIVITYRANKNNPKVAEMVKINDECHEIKLGRLIYCLIKAALCRWRKRN